MTVRVATINNKGQSYEAAQNPANNDLFISDVMVLDYPFLSCVHTSNETRNCFPWSLIMGSRPARRLIALAFHTLNWSRCECCLELLSS